MKSGRKVVVGGAVAFLAAALSCAASPFGEARWIGSNPALTPETDFSGAKWVCSDRVVIRFDADPGKPYELVMTAETPFTVSVNGVRMYKWTGHVYDGRFLTRLNLTSRLERGENEIDIVANRGREVTLIGIVRSGDGVVAVSSAEHGGTEIGSLRDTETGRKVDLREETASPAFTKRFTVNPGAECATLHVTGLGFYEASLDGRKIGDLVLDPSPTDYDDRVLYSTYDLGALTPGEHELSILLGHGWYDMRSVATWNFNHAPWRRFPCAIARLEVVYRDGTRSSVVTDGTWEQVESPVAYDCIREGEIVDARKRAMRPYGMKAAETDAPRGRLEPSSHPGSRIVELLEPEKIVDLGNGRRIVSFPRTISGWVRCSFRGLSSGDVVSIRYDENLDDGGMPARGTEDNWRASRLRGRRAIDVFFQQSGSVRHMPGGSSAQTDHFISAGGAVETFEPRFVYHGFRHVYLEGVKEPLLPGDIAACRVMTDFASAGSFSCSDAALTELVRMTRNSYMANFTAGAPTDCPHREKLAWTGDGWIASEFGLGFFDSASSYRKWLRDITDTMRSSGEICCIAPTSGWGFEWGNGPVFDAALAMIPWNLWLFRADREALAESYPALVKYLAYARTRETSPGLVANGLGDWNALNGKSVPSDEYVISSVRLMMLETAARMAEVLGKSADKAAYLREAAMSREAIRVKYSRGRGVFDNGGQTAQALAVATGLARNPQEEKDVAARLADSVIRTGCHIDFGLVGSKFVYRALSDVGRADLAYRMIVNPTEPSMTKWIGKNGTLWEDFGFGYSKCHIMLGDFAAWAQQYVAGIRRPLKPGYEQVVIEPDLLPGMTWAKGSVTTVHGEISSSWKVKDGSFTLNVTIPRGTRAEVRLPDGKTHSAGPGNRVFTGKCPADTVSVRNAPAGASSSSTTSSRSRTASTTTTASRNSTFHA